MRLAAALEDLRAVRFVMVGAPADDGAWQRALMQEIARTPNLEYLGHRSHAEVNELLGRSHIFVNTSMHEGFPNTFVQAWLRDVAVVSLQVDPDRVLELEKVGIAAGTEVGLQAAVRSLLEDPPARLALAERGCRHAITRHSLANARGARAPH